MINYFRKTFALSTQGAKDLVKATLWCTFTDISLMLPVGILYFLLSDFVSPLLGNVTAPANIWFYSSLCIVVLLILILFEYKQYNATFLASYTESANKRITLAEKLRKLPLSFFGKRDLSDLTTTIMTDCAGLETAFSHFIPELFGSLLSTIIVSIGLFAADWRLALALMWVVPAAFAIVLGGKKQQDKVNSQKKQEALNCSDSIQECIETIREIKANNQSDKYLSNVDEKLKKAEKINLKSELNSAIFVVSSQMLLRVGVATMVLTGSIYLVNGSIDFLTLLIFLIAASRIFDPLSVSIINLAAIFDSLIKVKRMQKIERYPSQEGDENINNNGYDICFDHVGFSYNNGENVLNDVSFTAKQGEVTALVGPSGGGKSTCAKLAARFWDIDKGKITLGKTDISTVDPENLLMNYSIVFQDVVLFNNTIMENIRIGRKNATDEEVFSAAKAAQCDEFIRKMPSGYETIIGENGSTLSGGERQRISIARALLKDSPIILLDEATASLDVENETLIQKAISNLIVDKTVLVIAHRMRTIAGADKIVVLSDGLVAQQGKPYELINKNGIYKHMVDLQNQSSQWTFV